MRIDITFHDNKNLHEVVEQDEKLTAEEKRQIHRSVKILRAVFQVLGRKRSFLYVFLELLEPVPVREEILLETDGRHLFYGPQQLIELYKKRKLSEVEEHLLHILFHGILGHFKLRDLMKDKALMDQCMDLEVHELGRRMGDVTDRRERIDSRAVSIKTARQLYYECRVAKNPFTFFDTHSLVKDHHEVWNREKKYHLYLDAQKISEESLGEITDSWEQASMLVFGKTETKGTELLRLAQQEQHIPGRGSNGDVKKYEAARENGRNYVDVLQEFFRCQEQYREDESTIDKKLYTYGFQTYGNVAMIEPEELSERETIGTVVVAVDTSGSCSGDVMCEFLREIGNILRDVSDMGFFEKIYLLQCDAQIQQVDCYESPEDFPSKLARQMKGFGGTDFRPVFDWIEQQMEKGVWKPDVLIFLSDGEGEFPDEEPNYPVHFVLSQKTYYPIPKWIHTSYL